MNLCCKTGASAKKQICVTLKEIGKTFFLVLSKFSGSPLFGRRLQNSISHNWVLLLFFFQSVLYKWVLLIHQIISDLRYESLNGVRDPLDKRKEKKLAKKINPLIYQRTCRIQIVTVPEMGRSQDWLSRLDSNTICLLRGPTVYGCQSLHSSVL